MTSIAAEAPPQHHCYVCGALTSKGCRDCGKVYYCGSKHAEDDRPRHQFECQSFDKIAHQWLTDTAVPHRKNSVSTKSRSKSRKTQSGHHTTTPHHSYSHSRSKSRTTPDDNNAQLNQVIDNVEMLDTMEPISTPSALKSKSKSKSQSKSHSKSKSRSTSKNEQRIDINVFLFPATEDIPQIVTMSCSVVQSTFEGMFHQSHYKSLLGTQEASFNTIHTSHGLFLVIRSSDDAVEEFDLEANRSIYNLTGGKALNWRGNVIVAKELVPKGESLGSVEEADLDILELYFRLDGNTSLNTLNRALFMSPSSWDEVSRNETDGYPFPEQDTLKLNTVDALLFPAASSHPRLITLPYDPETGLILRSEYINILGPDPIFEHIDTYKGPFHIGCRPRYGYEGEEGLWNPDAGEEGEEDFNRSIMCYTRRRGGWKRWPRANVLVLKRKSDEDVHTLYDEEAGARSYVNATLYDLAPLTRYFELLGTLSTRELERAMMTP